MAKQKLTRSEGSGVDALTKETTMRDEAGLDQSESLEPALDVGQESEARLEAGTDGESSGAREGEVEGAVEPVSVSSRPSQMEPPIQKDPLTQQIEQVLEEDLKDVYLSLPPEKQAEFLRKGEEVAGKIRIMIETAKFSFKKVLGLIRDWLKIIPGVNKFFLEQEAKIKADKVSHIVKGG